LLPVGEHRITLNHLGNVIYDSTIVVTDEYDRNTTTALVGGIVGGFVPFLLLPFPLNLMSILVPPLATYTADQLSTEKIIVNDFPKKISTEVSAKKDTAIYERNEISEALPLSKNSSEAVMYKVDPDKLLFLKFARNKNKSTFAPATSVCYDSRSDLVWAYEPFPEKTNTYYSNDFLPCELDSISYTSGFKAGLLTFATAAGIGTIVGSIVGGGKGAFAVGFATGAFVGLPTAYIVGGVVNSKNKRACQRFRNSEQVKQWYRRYSCRQNTNPIPESKNQ